MEIKLDSILVGRTLAVVVILLAAVSASVGAAGARSGGFEVFLVRLAPPLGVGILIIAATVVLKTARDRQGATVRTRAAGSGAGKASEQVRTVSPNRARETTESAGLGMRTIALVTGILGSLFSLAIGLLLIVVAILVEDLADDVSYITDFTGVDDIIVWVLAGIGAIFLIISGVGILGASLAMRNPGAALVLLSIVAGINGLIFILTLFSGEWRLMLLYLITTGLLAASAVCAFKGREGLNGVS